ncbi:molybdopterin-dependent oxidoreductase [candidate division CSSED10-310 bacterium]|uniref:Molybdopterin-dependent oxidoreductase n=1 Tax=candidate division CSSED10-310 bacterium TaxID=2855610 RepID=A0ABV6Z2J6_UNCC1
MVSLEIDGKQITAKEGQTIIEVASENGIEIPHFCYHPGLPISGNCRMCLVEIENNPKLQIACATPVREDMKVFTESEQVITTRKGILEFLLINHPVDCPICDQAGECSLQNYYQKYGLYESRFQEEKVHKGKVIKLGSGVVLDQERCVLCTRCVRVMRDIAADEQLGIFNRGDHAEIGTLTGEPLNSPYAGNVVDTCPVGALTSQDFRFQCRVWFLTTMPSICPVCATGCNIDIYCKDNKIYRLRPRENSAVNQHWMCDIGRYHFKKLLSEDRILTPLKRVEAGLETTAYDTVITEISQQLSGILQEHGSKAVGFMASPKLTNEDAFILVKYAKDFLDINNFDCTYKPEEAPFSDNILIKEDRNPNTHGCRDMGLLPRHGGMRIKDMLAAARRGTLQALVIFDLDLFDKPSQEMGIINALETVNLVVLVQTHRTRMLDYAQYVLPTVMWAEQEGTFTNFDSRVQRFKKAVDPPEGVKSISGILFDLAAKMGYDLPFQKPHGIFEDIAATIPAYKNISYAALGETGQKTWSTKKGI